MTHVKQKTTRTHGEAMHTSNIMYWANRCHLLLFSCILGSAVTINLYIWYGTAHATTVLPPAHLEELEPLRDSKGESCERIFFLQMPQVSRYDIEIHCPKPSAEDPWPAPTTKVIWKSLPSQDDQNNAIIAPNPITFPANPAERKAYGQKLLLNVTSADSDPQLRAVFSKSSDEYSLRRKHEGLGARLRIGLYGELISIPLLGGPQTDKRFLDVLKTADGSLELNLGWPDHQYPYAKVAPDGTITVLNDYFKTLERPNRPIFWPFRDEAGQLTAPSPGTALQAPKPTGYTPSAPPPNTLGWTYFDVSGDLIAPTLDSTPFDNAIWIRQTDNRGLELIHAGPSRTGIYALVAPDSTMTYRDEQDASQESLEGVTYYWPYRNKEGLPIQMMPEDYFTPKSLKTPEFNIQDAFLYEPDWRIRSEHIDAYERATHRLYPHRRQTEK